MCLERGRKKEGKGRRGIISSNNKKSSNFIHSPARGFRSPPRLGPGRRQGSGRALAEQDLWGVRGGWGWGWGGREEREEKREREKKKGGVSQPATFLFLFEVFFLVVVRVSDGNAKRRKNRNFLPQTNSPMTLPPTRRTARDVAAATLAIFKGREMERGRRERRGRGEGEESIDDERQDDSVGEEEEAKSNRLREPLSLPPKLTLFATFSRGDAAARTATVQRREARAESGVGARARESDMTF